MNGFYLKKYIFAACFLVFLLGFSIANAIAGEKALDDLLRELTRVGSVEDLNAWIQEAEDSAGGNVLNRMYFVESYGYVQKLLGKKEYNHFAFVKDTDGMLYYGSTAQSSTDDLQACADNIRRLNEYVEGRGAHLLVVIPPSKILPGKSQTDGFLPLNDPNRRVDTFLNLLQGYQVAAADLRIGLGKTPYTQEQLFFKTDHHWTPLAAFHGMAQIVETVRERFGDDWDPEGFYCNLENYHQYTYRQAMLGSSGRDTGTVYSGLDDYTMLWPRFDTAFTWTDYEHDDIHAGSFTQSLMDKNRLTVRDWFSGSVNQVYLNEVSEHDRIVNLTRTDGPKLAVLRDSYFSPVACFLAPMCSELDMVWGKSTCNDMDFDAFIRENTYDYLIVEVYPYNLEEASFAFFREERRSP